MILSGQEAVQTNRYNYLKMIKDTNLVYRVNNRVNNTGTALAWGESVLVGLYDTSVLDATDEVYFFNDSLIKWEILKVTTHWILISMYDTTSTYKFIDYQNTINPDSTKQYIEYSGNTLSIRKILPHKNYKNLDVRMRSLDTLDQYVDFGEMKMILDLDGTTIVYNLSTSLFNDLDEKNIDNVLFDLCISNDLYTPIIRGLKFEEKVIDLNYLVFSYYTNNGKKYIIFTTNSLITDYAIYPDIYISNNLYNNLSNDYRVPSLFLNMMNDIYVSELIEFYTGFTTISGIITTNDMSWCKEVYDDDILYDDTIDGITPSLSSYTVDSSSDDYSSEFPILKNNLGFTDSKVDITVSGSTMIITEDVASLTSFNFDDYVNVGDKLIITGSAFNGANTGIFEVTEVTSATAIKCANNNAVQDLNVTLGTSTIESTSNYIISYESRIYLMSDNETGVKRQNLNNLMCEFDVTSSGSDYDSRILQIYYYYTPFSRPRELIYMTYFPVMRFYDGIAKTFRVII